MVQWVGFEFELYNSQTQVPSYRFGCGSQGKENTRINPEVKAVLAENE